MNSYVSVELNVYNLLTVKHIYKSQLFTLRQPIYLRFFKTESEKPFANKG